MVNLFDQNIHDVYKDRDGIPESIKPRGKVEVNTSYGTFVPQFTIHDELNRKKENPVTFYSNGKIRALPLEAKTPVLTAIGPINCELVTFYESGNLRRIFPLNGKLSGYWTEQNELELAEEVTISTSVGSIAVKPVYIQFYEDGSLESILFWPGQTALIKSPAGMMDVRSGISFHKNGVLKSCEPCAPVTIDTPVGSVKAFDPEPNGINADAGSLRFSENSKIRQLFTAGTMVSVEKDSENPLLIKPEKIDSFCSESDYIILPLRIYFEKNSIDFKHNNIALHSFPYSAEFKTADFSAENTTQGD